MCFVKKNQYEIPKELLGAAIVVGRGACRCAKGGKKELAGVVGRPRTTARLPDGTPERLIHNVSSPNPPIN